MLVKECFNSTVNGILIIVKRSIPPRRVIAARIAYIIENAPK
jgi:hypothetical protein